jgi:hypothetical protein
MAIPGKKAFVCILLVAVFGFLFTWWRDSNEPEFEGKKISYWMVQYVNHRLGASDTAESLAAIHAIHQMGTNGLGYLIRLVDNRADNRRADRRLAAAFQQDYQRANGSTAFARIREFVTARAFGLRSSASDSIILSRGQISTLAMAMIQEVKPSIGNDLLTQYFAGADSATREYACMWLLEFANSSETFFACLPRLLEDNDSRIREMALKCAENGEGLDQGKFISAIIAAMAKNHDVSFAESLGKSGSVASNALPMLLQWLQSETNVASCLELSIAISQIDPKDLTARHALAEFATKARIDSQYHFRAVLRLGDLPDPPQIAPANLRQMYYRLYPEYIVACLKLGSSKEECLGALENLLLPPKTMENVAILFQEDVTHVPAVILKYFPDQPKAIERLLSVVKNNLPGPTGPRVMYIKGIGDEIIDALDALSAAGTNATAAIPELQRLRSETHPTFRPEIDATIQKIKGESAGAAPGNERSIYIPTIDR